MKSRIAIWICWMTGMQAATAQQAYFQQDVSYAIDVKLDDIRHELSASEKITYTNNSPDSLPFLYFHLWPNAYKNNSTQLGKQLTENGELLFHFAPDEDRGFIDGLDFKVDGESAKWELLPDTIDICRIWLKNKLRPGASITITTPFHVKIPVGKFSRLGHLGQQYQITQWYPKPAVYDRHGWNQIPFLNQGEFYSEFGTFDVSITLPENYVIGATGDLINAADEITFNERKYQETLKWQEDFHLNGKKNLAFPPSSAALKTLHFHQEKVHDFAWFCDKRYHLLKGEIETPHLHNKVALYALFTDAEADNWINSVSYIHDAVNFYSLWNGDYPYHHVTAVDGGLSAGGGMEYPNITVIGTSGNAFNLETVIMHEVGHNWFYGMLGSNERKNPWMDEGLNSFNENRYIETKYPNAKITGQFRENRITHLLDLDRYLHKHEYYLGYMLSARKEEDQPIQSPAQNYTTLNYAGIVYSKTALAFDYLMAYLGNPVMDEAMSEYFETWKYKHPEPADLRKILEKVSGKDLSWFFDDMLNTVKKLDYRILASVPASNGWNVLVKNTGEIKGPVVLCGVKNNKLRGIVWYDGFNGTALLSFPPVAEGIDYFMIDYNEDMPELNRKNNILYTKGLFKRTEPLKLQFLGSLDRSDRTQIFWTPVPGWNDYNRYMLGAAFYNTVLLPKRLEYVFMPLYAFGSKSLAGYGSIGLNFPMRSGPFQKIAIGVNASRYAYNDIPFVLNYNRLVPELNFEIRKKNPRSHLKQTIRLRTIAILKDDLSFDPSAAQEFRKTSDTLIFHDITWSLVNSRALNPWSLVGDYQIGQKIQKISLTANYEISFDKGKSIGIRMFLGTFLTNSDNPAYAFRMSGQTGYQDYLYDNYYLGRSETSGLPSRQLTETDGGFKVYSPLGQTSKWLGALNLKTSLPLLPKMFRLYADIGTCDPASLGPLNSGTTFLYNAGVDISVYKNILEIYLPLTMSGEIHDYLYTYRNFTYKETIRFTLNLNLLNPFALIKNFSL